MTETVVVAIITATSTLAAYGLASWLTAYFTLRSTREQGERQLRDAWEERLEQRRVEHDRTRRDAYVRFLAEALATAAVIRAARTSGLSEEEFPARYRSAERALIDLIPAHALVSLEGPPELAEAARKTRATLETELALIPEVRQGAKPESALQEARRQRALATGEMAVKARDVLGGDIDAS
jgi:hypothetical protein